MVKWYFHFTWKYDITYLSFFESYQIKLKEVKTMAINHLVNSNMMIGYIFEKEDSTFLLLLSGPNKKFVSFLLSVLYSLD